MNTVMTGNAISASLLARDVYCVCFPARDSLEILHGEFAAAREAFFTGGRKAVRAGKQETVKGFEGKLQGKLTRRGMYWRKTARNAADAKSVALEEAFQLRNGHLLVTRDFRGAIVSRMFFDRQMIWIKSEYYEPWDSSNAKVIFKPVEASDAVERFNWDSETNRYRSTMLYPIPYLSATAEQSVLNARFGEPQLILSTKEGEFCYCPKQEADARRQALKDLKAGSIVLMPAWEVKDGALAKDSGEEEPGLSFTSLEEYARVEPVEDSRETGQAPTPQEALPSSALQTGEEEFSPTAEEKQEEGPDEASILDAAKRAAAQESAPGEDAPAPEETLPADRQAPVQNRKLSGRGRTEQPGGLTAYEGEYQDGLRSGFGSYYYKDGSLCYAGFWKEDKKDGLGVSFRESDHALHVANWKEGRPGGMASLFDKDGNLRYSGRFEDGKKQGAGVSISGDDGSVFVGKWINGQATGVGSAFDQDGNLLYYGQWKDGKRDGHGTEFDKSGGIVFDGEWKDGRYYNGILYQKLERQESGGKEKEGPAQNM